MAIYRIDANGLTAVEETRFEVEGVFERRDIQRLLRENIGAIDADLKVIAEEFGDWIDSSRRIDLLCLDADANLVVVELKRTQDGGFMDLQAIRYASMISAMTFDQLVDVHARHISKMSPDHETAKSTILQFLQWVEVDEEMFGREIRIVLAAADFGKELTTSVLWLNQCGLDIRCVRLKPYRLPDRTILLDIQQLIPLPETAAFQTQIGTKQRSVRDGRAERHDLRRPFWEQLLQRAQPLTSLHSGRSATDDGWISSSIGRGGFSLTYSTRRFDSQVELWIGLGAGQKTRNKNAFHALEAHKTAIEAEFGSALEWQELPEGEGCRVRHVVEGGYRSPQEDWAAIHGRLIDAMIRLDRAMRPRVAALQI